MKVLLVNGSPRPSGCTYTALKTVGGELEKAGIGTEVFQAGAAPIRGCTACGGCRHKDRCVFDGDPVNTLIEKALDFDGFIFGTPVHYAAGSGAITSLLDRAFYAGSANFAYKPGACVVSCRRAGSTATLDQMNKYLTINNMPVVSSQYWNMVHGHSPEEVLQDLEGIQVMERIGKNMAWLLKCIALGKENGITIPAPDEKRMWTNFIR